MKLPYHTIQSAPHGSGEWLNADIPSEVVEAMEERLAKSGMGRLACKPQTVVCKAELEGATEHYGADEIARSLANSQPLPYDSLWGGLVTADQKFVEALDSVGAKYRAHPLQFKHRKTKRSWDLWLVQFTEKRTLSLLRDDAEPVILGDLGAYYNVRARDAITALGYAWLSFVDRKLDACTSVPIGDGPNADKTLRTAAGAAFLGKFPPVEVGAGYGVGWLIEKLQTKYSDATEERLLRALDGEPEGSLFYTRYPDGRLDAIGVRKDSALAKQLKAKKKK